MKGLTQTELSEDATGVLNFMASKTVFMILNNKRSKEEVGLEITVGTETIRESDHTKLLGVEIQNTQKWNIHVKNLTNSLTIDCSKLEESRAKSQKKI